MAQNKNTSSKKQSKSSLSNSIVDYKYNPRVETPDPKATTNKASEQENKSGS